MDISHLIDRGWELLAAVQETITPRRERIATAALQGLAAFDVTNGQERNTATLAVSLADALIAELDKPSTNESADGAQGAPE